MVTDSHVKGRLPADTPDIALNQSAAWKLRIPGPAVLSAWIVHAPWAHPVWHSYSITGVHLRRIPETPDPVIHRPGATHELVVCALQPNQFLRLDEPPHYMTPPNFIGQWIDETDIGAIEVIDKIAKAVTYGRLHPDTDFRPQWTALFGAFCLEPAEREYLTRIAGAPVPPRPDLNTLGV